MKPIKMAALMAGPNHPQIVSFSRGQFFQDGDLQACKGSWGQQQWGLVMRWVDFDRYLWDLTDICGYYPRFNGTFFQILCFESCDLVYNESRLLQNIRIKAVW